MIAVPRSDLRAIRRFETVASIFEYATTIHKAQGAMVDRTYVLASGSMDRHLTYVSMTRLRDQVTLYAGQDEFKDVAALSSRLSRAQTPSPKRS